MRVFVTGAAGFIGSAVVDELLRAGHEVTGLARNDANAAKLEAAGAKVHRGDLRDAASLQAGAGAADAVLHLAFIHDFSKFAENGAIDKRAIEAMGEVLAGSDRPLIVTSGTALLSPGVLADEDTQAPVASQVPRVSEQTALALKGVRASAVRLPPTVHGDGDHGFIPILIKLAQEKGEAAYIGTGDNRWPAVHRLDAARVYRLALENGRPGRAYHAVAEQGVPMREIATVIGKKLNVPVVSKTAEQAAAHFGWFAHFAGVDNPTSSDKTRAELGWQPTRVGLLDDLEHGTYFNE